MNESGSVGHGCKLSDPTRRRKAHSCRARQFARCRLSPQILSFRLNNGLYSSPLFESVFNRRGKPAHSNPRYRTNNKWKSFDRTISRPKAFAARSVAFSCQNPLGLSRLCLTSMHISRWLFYVASKGWQYGKTG
ncbi:hypothetical protein JL2886_01140 [Phaeobacter gallaeciensis]|uniref:Uncharacterized protein n=1 Tax=Phaeobacter gallaeciensis TaxID=60890 RepID=A0A1B0ZPM5_9RHOB|nr:hypothetical protein JL2886_01140 [Phaeobacter gallaeciensis]